MGAELENIARLDDTAATTPWAASFIAPKELGASQTIPLIEYGDVKRAIEGIDLWDSWPVQNADGSIARINGREFWMALAAPYSPDTKFRHHHARIRLLERDGADWIDCGNVLPDGFSPGSREWAGSAIYDSADGSVTVYFTAAGRRGEDSPTFEQRIFKTIGKFSVGREGSFITDWSEPDEILVPNNDVYLKVDQADGEPGKIKAFRDPAYFKDPADGQEYLLFTGSLKHSKSEFNGAIGIAKASANGASAWLLLAPLVTADHLNNELERPQIIVRNGLYYLFWSTQSSTFAPDGPVGPNGLYGMVAESVLGPYRPLNGAGLVAANPPAEPLQAYSWLVLDTLEVASFIDYWGLKGRSVEDDPELARQQFGGTFAPFFKLSLNGDSSEIVG